MTLYLWELLEDGISEIGDLNYGRATNGSATTLVDTNRPDNEQADKYLNATLIILRDGGGAGAAPEGEFSRVTSYSPSSNTFNLADTLTAAVASGDRYGVSGTLFQHDELIELANKAIRRFDVGVQDISITSADNQTEYTLPIALKRRDLMRVEVQGMTDDANDNRWMTIDSRDISFAVAGTATVITLPQLPPDRTVRITYMARPPKVNAFNDVVSEYIHPELAKASFVERLYNRLVETTSHSTEQYNIGFNKATKNFEDALIAYPIWNPRRHKKYTFLGRPYTISGGPNRVRL